MSTVFRESILRWYRRYFSDPQVVSLVILLAAGSVLTYFFIGILMPVFVSVIIAYVLDGPVTRLQAAPVSRPAAVVIVFSLFMAFFLAVFAVFIPLLYREVALLVQELPSMIAYVREQIQVLSQQYPDVVSPERIEQVQDAVSSELSRMGEILLQVSLTSVMSVFTVLVYLVMVPFLTFFFLKDKGRILAWLSGILPSNSGLIVRVWEEVNGRFSDYVRGKVWEILIEWGVAYLGFFVLGLNFALLLSFFVGLSVLVPYIGVLAAALPAFLVALLQWGVGVEIIYLLVIFAMVQIVSSNIISPLLFSEIVNLHPVVIIIALLIFGEIWGIWGLVFAIPLTVLIQTVVNAWIGTVRGTPDP